MTDIGYPATALRLPILTVGNNVWRQPPLDPARAYRLNWVGGDLRGLTLGTFTLEFWERLSNPANDVLLHILSWTANGFQTSAGVDKWVNSGNSLAINVTSAGVGVSSCDVALGWLGNM